MYNHLHNHRKSHVDCKNHHEIFQVILEHEKIDSEKDKVKTNTSMSIFQQRWDTFCNSSLGKSLPREILTYIHYLLYISMNHDLSYPYFKPIIANAESGFCERTLQGHTNYVRCVSVFMGSDGDPRIVSGSSDNTLKVLILLKIFSDYYSWIPTL